MTYQRMLILKLSILCSSLNPSPFNLAICMDKAAEPTSQRKFGSREARFRRPKRFGIVGYAHSYSVLQMLPALFAQALQIRQNNIITI